MAMDYAYDFYNSQAWRKTRRAYADSVHWLCERCLANDVLREGDIVHHKEYISPDNINDSDVTLNWDNLELLCQTCHNQEHFSKYDEVRDDVMFDSNGDLVKRSI